MRIATWNCNSLRARLPRLLPWLEADGPEVVMLQETKCMDDQFPREELEAAGYSAAIFGQKTYNGVAILAKGTIEDVRIGLGDPAFDEEARVIGAQVGDTLLLNVYVINGREVGHPRYDDKLRWYGLLRDRIADTYDLSEKFVLGGDFNVTVDDRDVYDPDRWHERILCSTKERTALGELFDLGLVDSLRRFHEEPGVYTWWDYRTRGFQRGNGLRIDHLLMSEPAFAACRSVEVDLEMRGGTKPSDHAPVVATFE